MLLEGFKYYSLYELEAIPESMGKKVARIKRMFHMVLLVGLLKLLIEKNIKTCIMKVN